MQKALNDNCCDSAYQNPFLIILKYFAGQLLNFRLTADWEAVTAENVDNIDFPEICFEPNQKHLYDDLLDHDLYWLSIGSYEIKAADAYINMSSAAGNFFQAQILKPYGSLYKKISERYFHGKPIKLLRCKVPTSHKISNMNQHGYRVYIAYYSILRYQHGHPEIFLLDGKETKYKSDSGQIYPNYYFKNAFEYSYCTCRSGARTMGDCAHRIAACMLFGSKDRRKFKKRQYQALDGSSFRPLELFPDE